MKSFFFKQKYLVLSLGLLSLIFLSNHPHEANATSGSCLVNQQTFSTSGWTPGDIFAENANCALPGKTVNIISLNVAANATSKVIVKIYAGNATIADPTGPISTGPGKLMGESSQQTVTGTGIQNFTLSAIIPSNYSNFVWVSFETNNNTLSLKYSPTGAFFGGGCPTAGCYFSGFHSHTFGTGPNPFGTLTQIPEQFWAKIYYSSTPTTLVLNSTNGNVGSTIQATGFSYGNNTSVLIKYDNTPVTTNPASPVTDHLGEFNNTLFTIPQSVAGPHIVNGTDGLNNFATVSYNVTSSLGLSGNSGNVGALVNGHAYGFRATHAIHIKFDGTIYQNGTTNGVGSFSTIALTIPSATAGFHTISATDGSHTASTSYYVLGSSAVITSNSTSGAIGKILSISGGGFNASATIRFYFNNALTGTTPAIVTSNATGGFKNVLLTVPGLALGTYTIKANDTGGNFGTTTYTVNSLGPALPDAVLDLQFTNVTQTTINLSWTQPNLNGGTFSNYYINMTTPYGNPNFILTPFDPGTTALVTTLTKNTQYSFRVGIVTNYGVNPYGNILNVQTLAPNPGNFTVGVVQLNGTNPVHQPITFTQTAGSNSSFTNVNVFRPTSYNLNCNVAYTFAATSKNYTNLSKTVYDAATVYSTFQFKNSQNEIITIKCTDSTTGNSASTVLTQTNSPLLQQVNNFRNGTYGTKGQLGSLDLITVVAVIISMIGFNRVNEAAGVILSIIMVGVLAFFQIIQWPTVMLAALAVVVMVAVASTRKTSGT